MEIETAKITNEGQALIPKEFIEHLGLNSGDEILMAVDQNSITITKAGSEGKNELRVLTALYSEEWNSEEDGAAFDHL